MNTSVEESPTRIGNRYRLDERIGAGAMGAVWRGTDELLNRTVALKELLAAAVPPTAAGADALEESRQRIMREGRIGARLQHPHVISMFDVVVHDDRPWLVMEYLPSRSLAAVLSAQGPMDPHEAADMGRQVADGLAAAHAAGVVHRDVKPGNVLLADDGRVKLTDFGVSRAVGDVQLTRTGMIAGTPAFLSPEVARGSDPTAAADVFALGATLYAAVEGHPPFGVDDNAYALLHKVATGDVRPPDRAGPLTALLMRLLSNDPGDRPSALQARDTLAAIAEGHPAAPGPGPVRGGAATAVLSAVRGPDRAAGPGPATVAAAPPVRLWVRGRRRTSTLVALFALLLVGGGILAWALAGDPTAVQAQPPAALPTSAPTSAAPSPSSSPQPPSAEAPLPVADPIGFVQGYYGLLPDDTEGAFALLGPVAQEQSNGRSGFEEFWAGIESVTLVNVQAVGENIVEAGVVFDRGNGPAGPERYRFVMATDNGRRIMESFSTS